MATLYLSGRIYDWLIEPLVFRLKGKVKSLIDRFDLFPVVDICCGTGTQLHLLQSGKGRLVGIDLSFPQLNYASHKYPKIPFVCADAVNIPFQSASFKGIVISFSLHDKSQRVQAKLMSEAKRVLKPGGQIIFIDFENPWSKKSRAGSVFVNLIERIAGGEHFRNYRQFLREGGLRAFVQKQDLIEAKRYNMELGALAIVVAMPQIHDDGH
jgi:ubiquinone/menaquinone biosynthesis C-methylase UbiE